LWCLYVEGDQVAEPVALLSLMAAKVTATVGQLHRFNPV
jgi:hypothetical protein